jgi:hypothetical protein
MLITRQICQILKVELSRKIFEKSSNIKFNENPSSRSRVVPCGQTYKQTDMMKLIVAFRNSAKGPKDHILFRHCTSRDSNAHIPSKSYTFKETPVCLVYYCFIIIIIIIIIIIELVSEQL